MADFIGTLDCSIYFQFKANNGEAASEYLREIRDNLEVIIRPLNTKAPMKMLNAIDTAEFEIDNAEVER